ncbi:MAG TPA: antibiotic biosynthesis monooxygenase [Actinomycetota bacterium]|nr:antibiotic biosynthesis monooxygenase [Actinomycetota bacterium]
MNTDMRGNTNRAGLDADTPNHYASGTWHVTPGKERDFIELWTDFLQWTREAHPALASATLIRNGTNESHFVSFAAWPEAAARDAWKQDPVWGEKHAALRALCSDFHGGDYNRLVTI